MLGFGTMRNGQKQKTRLGIESGLAWDQAALGRLSRFCAYHHRRQADPRHQTRLPAAIALAEVLTQARTERFTSVVMITRAAFFKEKFRNAWRSAIF